MASAIVSHCMTWWAILAGKLSAFARKADIFIPKLGLIIGDGHYGPLLDGKFQLLAAGFCCQLSAPRLLLVDVDQVAQDRLALALLDPFGDFSRIENPAALFALFCRAYLRATTYRLSGDQPRKSVPPSLLKRLPLPWP